MIKNNKKTIANIILIVCALLFTPCAELSGAESGGEETVYIQPVAAEAFLSDGKNTVLTNGEWEQFTVNLKVTGAEAFAEKNDGMGINSYTFFVTYDPSVVRMTGITYPSESEIEAGYVYYDNNGSRTALYNGDNISKSISYVPISENKEYADVNSDGVKSCGELGKVKMAYYISSTDSSGRLLTAERDGILVGLTFRAVGEGDTKLAVGITDYANGFSSSPYSEKAIETAALEGNIYVRDISSGGKMGDLDFDGFITDEDARLLLGHISGIQTLSWKQLQYADVTGSGVDMRDVIAILKNKEK